MSCTRIMDTRLQEVEGFGEESSGKKKSKFKSIKKFFGKRKRKETLPSSGTGSLKLYQSTSDVTTSESMHVGYDSEDELEIHSSIMGSRALSHDSIFISEAAQEPARPVRVFSQENVSGRIRALQMKLQQNWKFGRSSPFGATSKRMDDAGMSSEDDGLPRSPPEMSPLQEIINSKTAQFSDSHKHLSSLSLAGTGSEEEEQVTSGSWRSCSAESQLIPRKSSVKIAVPISEGSLSPPGDFDTPPEFTTVLDNSAAKHKLLIKPRNQRSRKMRRLPSKSLSESQNDLSSTPEEDECERKEALAELIYDGVSSSCQALAESTASSNNVLYSRQLEMSKGLELGLSHQDEKSSMLHSASPLDLPPFENNSEGCQTGQGLTTHTVPSLPSSEQKENITTLHLIPELGTQRDKECYETQKICPKNLSSSLNQENKNISDVPSKSSVLPDKNSSTKNDVLPTLDGTSKDTGTPALAEDLSSKVSSSLGNSPLPKSHFQLTDVAGPENSSYSSSPCIAAASQKGTPSTWSLDKMKLTQELPASDKENNPPPAPDVYIWGGKTEKENSELGALKKFSISSSRERLRTGSLSMKENLECEHPVNTQVLRTKIKGSSRDGKLKEANASQEKKNSTSKQTPPQSELESTGKGLCRVEPETLLQAINPASVPMNSGGGLPQQPGANQSEGKDKNPFQVKLRSTSLSLRYRDSSSRESKETKRHSAEFNLEKEGLPSPLMKSERAEGRKTTDINIGDTLNETSKTKTKSPEQSGAKPPLPRKPVLQHAVITGTNTSSEKQEKVIKCPESKNEEQKNLEKSEVPEKSVPSPVSTVDAARGTESQTIPAWVTIAKQKQRVIEEELSREEKPVVYSKMDAEKQKKETERMEEAVKQQTDHTQATSLPLSSTVPSEEETKETKSNTQEMLPRPGLLSHSSPVPLEKEDAKLYKKVTHSPSDQPLWMELAKKKSQAWSDMPPMIK